MSVQLYFFKFDRELASDQLTKTLLTEGDKSFRNYLQTEIERQANSQYDKINTSFEVLVQKVKSNIELITEEELELIYDWFYERNSKTYVVNGKSFSPFSEIIFKKDLLDHGIDEFDCWSHSKQDIRTYYDYMSEYERRTGIEIGNDCESEQFLDFLDCLIAYSIQIEKILYPIEYEEEFGAAEFSSKAHQLALKSIHQEIEGIEQYIKSCAAILDANNSNDLHKCFGDDEDQNDSISDLISEGLVLGSKVYARGYFESLRKKIINYGGRIKMYHSF